MTCSRRMRSGTCFMFALAIFATIATPAAFAQSFTGLGFLPGGTQSSASRVNRDGSVVVGSASSHAFRWTSAGGMVDLGTLPGGTTSNAADVSDDGSVVVGSSGATPGTRVFRWTSALGMVDLGLPPDGGGDGQATSSYGGAVSGYGAVVAGFSDPVNDALRWTNGGGMASLGTLLGIGYSIAYDSSYDGAILVGESTGSSDDHAFRWSAAAGLQDLGTMPGGTSSHAMGVSADGGTVVGYGGTSGFTNIRAFRWTSASGMVSLGAPAGMASRAYGVSGNGKVVVGTITSISSPDHAMLWTPSLGMVDLNTWLPSIHIDLSGWNLTTASGVSADGLTLVGSGTHNGRTEAWVAHLPSPAPAGSVPDVMVDIPGATGAPGDLTLSWGASCRSTDSDFAVYEGVVGDFTSHVPRLCGTGGATTATLTPAAGNRYYLVVPLSPGGAEGSYGTTSAGLERAPSALACAPQVFPGCP